MNYINIFSNLGFDFKIDLKPRFIEIEKEPALSNKLVDTVFFYKNSNNSNTSFYLITNPLDSFEIGVFRKYAWNKNDADIIFYFPSGETKLAMLYAKYSPMVSNQESVLDTFSTTQKDVDAIDKIKHWRFDSGVFWLNYSKYIDKAKYKGIDKELVFTLKALREQINKLLLKLIPEDNKRNEIVQALIDRTLYIKYLEDNHIINSYFFEHYFEDSKLNYEILLGKHSIKDINKLYKIIHEIFNNALFDQPTIEGTYLTHEICQLIAASFKANLNTGQLRLYDFSFNVLPVEFISYIYEVFLSEKQKENGIYYTPKKLAQLIIDDVINEDKIGTILDASSGSGMFLIVAYQRFLEIAQQQGLEPNDNIEKIKYRIQLLSENIFGIEKELTAQRFTLFSLSLQIFTGIDPTDIKDFITKELKENKKINLFSEYSFFQNIKHANTLNISDTPFKNKQFLYLVGNPPFFEIPNTAEFYNEINFLKSFQISVSNGAKKVARDIVGKSQISQCFFLKIKEWSNKNTRFGFVSNSSNFYNDFSEVFQEYFYSNYGIEKIYELSRVKKILFENAKESVLAIIFTNNVGNNIFGYYTVDLGLFSEKPFELLIIQEDKVVKIGQNKLIGKQVRLRDYLVGNQFDLEFVNKIHDQNDILGNHLNTLEGSKSKINNGLQIVGKEQLLLEFNLSDYDYKKLTKGQKTTYSLKFKQKYTSTSVNKNFPTPLLEPIDLFRFGYSTNTKRYLGNISNFQRARNNNIYFLPKILINRTGKELKACVCLNKIFYNFDVYSIFPKEEWATYLFAALINSKLANYVIDLSYRKRVDGSYTKIGYDAILNIPVPRELNIDEVRKISVIGKEISEGKFIYSEKEKELNELIYDLYELSYWERTRVEDYFLPKLKIVKSKKVLDNYKNTVRQILDFYLKHPVFVEDTKTDFDMIVVKISFIHDPISANATKAKRYLLNEIFEQNPNANILESQEKIFGKDCVYIIKKNINKNWTETKAFEDGQDILKHLIPNENGERIH